MWISPLLHSISWPPSMSSSLSAAAASDQSESIHSAIVDALSSSVVPLKKKKLLSRITKSGMQPPKRKVKEVLKELVTSGRVREVEEEGSNGTKKTYALCNTNESSQSSSPSSSELESDDEHEYEDNSDESMNGKEEESLPFSEVLRRRKSGNDSDADINGKKVDTNTSDEKEDEIIEDIDDEIRRLEAELAADDNSDGDSDGSIISDEESDRDNKSQDESCRKRKISFGPATKYSDNDDDEKCLPDDGVIRSNLSEDRIAPLPKSALPQMKRRKLKGIDEDDDNDTGSSKKNRQRNKDRDTMISDGLRDAVKEVLGGYVARSHERIPFYCRVCLVQSDDMESFLAHKETDFHKAAVRAERKATYCQACRKQFTSPVQMKEHLESKPHHERMAFLRSKTQGGSGGRSYMFGRNGRGHGGQGGRGYGGRGRGPGKGSSKRQWC